MHPTAEKILYGAAALSSSAASTLGAIMTEGDTRWFFVTMTASILTACFLALIFKKPEESIRIVVGRSGIAILCGVLLSRWMVHKFGIEMVDRDVVALAGLAAGVTIGGFLVGYKILHLINSKSDSLAKKVFDKWT
jgi:hypothetical protein